MNDNLPQNDTDLQILLEGITDENERGRLIRTWEKLGCMAELKHETPPPSRELERIFAGNDEQMSEDELHLLAAAGMMQGTEGDDTLNGTMGQDFIEGLGGDDQIDGGYGDDWIDGGEGNDTMHGDSGDDTMIGGSGDDEMHGGDDNDTMTGGSGEDTLDGGSGDDRLYGGYGDEADVLTGGDGTDTYVFSANSGTDTITDFNPGEDYLDFLGAEDISNIEVSNDANGNTVVTFGATTIILEGVTMTQEEVWARRAQD